MILWMWQASIGLLAFLLLGYVSAWGSNPDRVLLRDVEVLTLRAGKMTNGRRSSPVPQLECMGGSAAKFFKPQVVQCYSRGSDGFDIQWECKTDMESDYRIGHLEVNCEGYDYPEDPYILRGSCGLRYTLDFTKAGMENKNAHYHDYYGDGSDHYGGHHEYSPNQYRDAKSMSSSSFIANIIVMCAVGLMLFALYKTCVDRSSRQHAYSTTNDDPHPGTGGGGGGYGWFGGQGGTYPSAPPPPTYEGDSCRNRTSTNGGGGGGFWTGAATGGLLGYMLGQRGSGTHYNTGYGGHAAPRSFFSGQSGYSRPAHHHAPPSAPRTASGFGGTTRR